MLIGYFVVPGLSPGTARYAAMVLLCCLEAVLGFRPTRGVRADLTPGMARLLAYVALSVILLFISDRLGLELYIAALAALGYRIYASLDALVQRLAGVEPGIAGTAELG